MASIRAARSVVLYLFANGLSALVPFALIPVLTDRLRPEEFGRASIYFLLVIIATSLIGINLHGAISVKYFKMNKELVPKYLGLLIILTALSFGVWFLASIIGGVFSEGINGISWFWVRVALISAALQSILNISFSLLQVQERVVTFVTLQLFQSFLLGVITWVSVSQWNLGWIARPIGQMMSILVCTFIMYFLLNKGKWIEFEKLKQRSDAIDALRFGVPLMPHTLSSIGVASASQFLIQANLGERYLGYYSLALQFGAFLALLADAFVKTYRPWLYQQLVKNTEESRVLIVVVVYASIIGFSLIGLLFSMSTTFIFPYIVGIQFQSAVHLIPYFASAGAFLGMYMSVADLIFFSSKTSFISIGTLTSAAIGIPAMYFLGKSFGIDGYAMGYALSQFCAFFFAWIISAKVFPLPWLEFSKIFKFFQNITVNKRSF
jgi:O-antigen/teichoic acid export membrane protein